MSQKLLQHSYSNKQTGIKLNNKHINKNQFILGTTEEGAKRAGRGEVWLDKQRESGRRPRFLNLAGAANLGQGQELWSERQFRGRLLWSCQGGHRVTCTGKQWAQRSPLQRTWIKERWMRDNSSVVRGLRNHTVSIRSCKDTSTPQGGKGRTGEGRTEVHSLGRCRGSLRTGQVKTTVGHL